MIIKLNFLLNRLCVRSQILTSKLQISSKIQSFKALYEFFVWTARRRKNRPEYFPSSCRATNYQSSNCALRFSCRQKYNFTARTGRLRQTRSCRPAETFWKPSLLSSGKTRGSQLLRKRFRPGADSTWRLNDGHTDYFHLFYLVDLYLLFGALGETAGSSAGVERSQIITINKKDFAERMIWDTILQP